MVRPLLEMSPVLADPLASGPNPVYWVFTNLGADKWVNMTVITAGRYGREYPKLFGHFHSDQTPETFHVASGEGILVLQKNDEVLLVTAQAGMEINLPGDFGHTWVNASSLPLIFYDDRRIAHTPADYEPVEKTGGLAYYLIEENGQPKAIPNPHYQNPPAPIWLTADEFRRREKI